jgi:hypothetical protein
MSKIVLFRIVSLHARSIQETGLKVCHRGRDFYTGPIVAVLDDRARVVGNLGMIDLETGAIKIRWAVLTTMPFLADALARGKVSENENAPVRVSFHEHGHLLGEGFHVKGPGRIAPGSVFSGSKVQSSNRADLLSRHAPPQALRRRLAAGKLVRCAFVPEHSVLDIELSDSLGSGWQRFNLSGGFSIRPVMALRRQLQAAERNAVVIGARVSPVS